MTSEREITNYMTLLPLTIEPDLDLEDAKDRMYSQGIRHLPVVWEGDVVGLISDRDVAEMETSLGKPSSKLKVKDAMRRLVSTCDPDTPLEDVLAQMRRLSIDAVVITKEEQPVGIFTAVDAVALLAHVIKEGTLPSHLTRERPVTESHEQEATHEHLPVSSRLRKVAHFGRPVRGIGQH